MTAGQRWTRMKPTEPGWYWIKLSTGYVKILHVRRCEFIGKLVTEDAVWLKDMGEVLWQGPLSPHEATE